MANVYIQNPLILDTDIASYQAVQTLVAGANKLGLKIRRLALFANASTVAGTVTVTDPTTTNNLVPPTAVVATQAAGTLIFEKEYKSAALTWLDFKVTGLTATKTTLMVWFSY